MVNMNHGREGWGLYDLRADPGEQTDIAARSPKVVAELNTAYDRWWDEVLPDMENEDAVPPEVPPYHELYRRQFGAN